LERGTLKDKDKEPYLGPLDYYVNCFFELGTCRSDGGPIPFTSIFEFSKIYNEYDFDEFLYIIRLMDDVYLKHRSRENKDGDSNKNNKGSG